MKLHFHAPYGALVFTISYMFLSLFRYSWMFGMVREFDTSPPVRLVRSKKFHFFHFYTFIIFSASLYIDFSVKNLNGLRWCILLVGMTTEKKYKL